MERFSKGQVDKSLNRLRVHRRGVLTDSVRVLPALAVGLWIVGIFQGIMASDLEYDRSIFQNLFYSHNYAIWASLIIILVFLLSAIWTGNKRMLASAIVLTLLVLGCTPYLLNLGRSHDSYSQMGFARLVASTGHVPKIVEDPSFALLTSYSSWPGSFLLDAMLIVVTLPDAIGIIRLYPVLNLAVFAAGTFLLAKTAFRESRIGLYSVLFVFLGSDLVQFDSQMNWSTLAMIPLFLATSVSLDRRRSVISVILFAVITLSHPFNGIIALGMFMLMMLGARSMTKHRGQVLFYGLLFLSWFSLVSLYGLDKIVELMLRMWKATVVESVALTTAYVSSPRTLAQFAHRYVLGVLALGILVSFVRRRHLSFSLPAIVLLGGVYATQFLAVDPWLSFRTLGPAYFLGFPAVASLAYEFSFHRRQGRVWSESKRIIRKLFFLFLCLTLVMSYVVSAYPDERYFATFPMDLAAASFLNPLFAHNVQTQALYHTLWVTSLFEVHYVSYEAMSRVVPVNLAEASWADIVIVNERWFSEKPAASDLPVFPQEMYEMKSHIELSYLRVYSNGRIAIYTPSTGNR